METKKYSFPTFDALQARAHRGEMKIPLGITLFDLILHDGWKTVVEKTVIQPATIAENPENISEALKRQDILSSWLKIGLSLEDF